MPRSSTTIEAIRRSSSGKYIWPEFAMNIWWIIMLATGGVLIGVFAQFINVQNHFNVGIPWCVHISLQLLATSTNTTFAPTRLFPYGITVGALTVLYTIYALLLLQQDRLVPVVIMILTFILFGLYLAGVIETAIQLFANGNSVSDNCQTYVMGMPQTGQTLNTLAWLEQESICRSRLGSKAVFVAYKSLGQSWYAVFAFWIIGSVFMVWIFIIAATVNSNRPNY